MSKAVMLSIKPKWCELIANGKKTVEVRKTRPKLDTPFKGYIYCTKNGSYTYHTRLDENRLQHAEVWNGKVIGEFVCDFVYENIGYDSQGTCLSADELKRYAKGKPLYAWHISDLVIYDKPKELSEFQKEDFHEVLSNYEDLFSIGVPEGCVVRYPPEPKKEDYILTSPPLSWQYVEELSV